MDSLCLISKLVTLRCTDVMKIRNRVALLAALAAPSAVALFWIEQALSQADRTQTNPQSEEILLFLPSTDERESIVPVSAEKLMIDQLFDFGNL